jgi:hypothetical protein
LQRAAVPTVPTLCTEPGDEAGKILARFLQEHGAAELIIKPAVGSGARDARRYPRAAVAEMRAHISRLLSESRSALLQPYLERVDEQGEAALIYIDGAFSHAIVKAPVKSRAHRYRADAPEQIAAPPECRAAGTRARVLAALRPQICYTPGSICCTMTAGRRACLSWARPSLYLGYSENAPLLAGAIVERVQARSRRLITQAAADTARSARRAVRAPPGSSVRLANLISKQRIFIPPRSCSRSP